jgi:vacuolar-type H+-ATPase subunit H
MSDLHDKYTLDSMRPAEPVVGTPRTETAVIAWEATGSDCVYADFARQLERELEAMRRAFNAEERESYTQAKRAEKAEHELGEAQSKARESMSTAENRLKQNYALQTELAGLRAAAEREANAAVNKAMRSISRLAATKGKK